MNVLLDTHILLWLLAQPQKLPSAAVQAIEQANKVFFSPVNLWEIGIKSQVLPQFKFNLLEDIYLGALGANLHELIITSVDTMFASKLPKLHKDPFDRLLIAQSHNRSIHLLSVDGKISKYNMPFIICF